MDRRHWHIVSKLQDSLGLKSAQLEAFLCQDGTFANFQSFVNAETTALFVWQVAGIERRDTLMPSELEAWTSVTSADGSSPSSASLSTFACDSTPPGKFANKCVYFIWTEPAAEASTVAPATSSATEVSAASTVSSTVTLAQDLRHEAVYHVVSSADAAASTADLPFEATRSFGECIITGELEPDLGADLQASLLTTLLPHLSLANWGQASSDDVVAFHGVSCSTVLPCFLINLLACSL